MTIAFEQVEEWQQLPFKFYQHDATNDINVAPHWHTGIELNFLVAGGALDFVTDGQITRYVPGDCWAVNRRVVHSVKGDNALKWDEFGFIIDDTFLVDKLPTSQYWHLKLRGQAGLKNDSRAYQQLFDQAQQIRHLLTDNIDDYRRMEILGHFYQLLVLLGQHFSISSDPRDVPRNAQLVTAVMRYIHKHFAENMLSQDLADYAHVSQTTLNQQFQASLGMSVQDYLRQIRLMNAKKLLMETPYSIAYIASQCGFGSIKTFQRHFSQWTHKTPTQFRRSSTQPSQNDAGCF